MYSIQEAAKQLDVSIHTLRYYEKEGLTPFIKRNKQGARIYTDTDIQWIYMIRCLRDIEMPIADIRAYINLYMVGDKTLQQRQQMMYDYKAYIEKKMKSLEICLGYVTQKITYYDQAISEDEKGMRKTSLSCSDYRDEWEWVKDETNSTYNR